MRAACRRVTTQCANGRTCGRRRHRRKGEVGALVLQKLHCEPLASISSTTRDRAFFNENLVFSEMFYLQQNMSSFQNKKKKTCNSAVRFGVDMVLEDSFHNLGFNIVWYEERALIFRTNILPHLHRKDEKTGSYFPPEIFNHLPGYTESHNEHNTKQIRLRY